MANKSITIANAPHDELMVKMLDNGDVSIHNIKYDSEGKVEDIGMVNVCPFALKMLIKFVNVSNDEVKGC